MQQPYSHETKQRLLNAAYETFSESGYERTSIRQIVLKAGTSVASVNYHFGSKEQLYQEVVKLTLYQYQFDLEAFTREILVNTAPIAIIRGFAKERIKRSIISGNFLPPKLLGWEIISSKLNTSSFFDKSISQIEKNLLDLLDPILDKEMQEIQKKVIVRWFFSNTMPPPPIGFAVKSVLENNSESETSEKIVDSLADAIVCGVKRLAQSIN